MHCLISTPSPQYGLLQGKYPCILWSPCSKCINNIVEIINKLLMTYWQARDKQCKDIVLRIESAYSLDSHSKFLPPSGKVNQSYCFNIGFWLKEASYKEQPEVHFKHQFILFLQGLTSDSYVAYSTYQNFNNLVNDKLRIPVTKVVYCLMLKTFYLPPNCTAVNR